MPRTSTLTCLVAAAVLLVAASAATAKRRSHGKAKEGAPAKKEAPAKKPEPSKTGFPTSCEVDQFLDDTPSMAPKERLPAAVELMTRMVNVPPRPARDRVWLWEYFLQRWANRFLARGDMDVLESVDQAPLDVNFSRAECSLFYRAVLKDIRAVEHYRYQSNRGRLALCFETDELGRILGLPVEGTPKGSIYMARVRACDVDDLIGTLTQTGPRASPAAVHRGRQRRRGRPGRR